MFTSANKETCFNFA